MRATTRIYKSFEEFERDELHKLDSLSGSIDDMLDEMFAEEVDEGGEKRSGRGGGGGRKRESVWD